MTNAAALNESASADETIVGLLLDSLQKLAAAGEVEAACRIAGRTCMTLRLSNPRAEHRFNALLHRLVRLLPVEGSD